MVFSNLQPHEKDAFFSLLDEYFSARPEIFAGNAGQSSGGPAQTTEARAVSAVGRAMANNPEATANFMSAGLKHVANARAGAGTGNGGGAGASGVSDNEATSVAGRVAAASMAFSASRNSQPPPSRMSPPPIAEKPQSKLVSQKKFGNVDTSSTIGFLGSLRNSNNKPPGPPVIPSAFGSKQNNFAPPPARRTGSANATPSPGPAAPPPPPPRHQPEPEPEPEVEGEWADVLYDYNSGEAGDLVIAEGQRIIVTERTSDDWWTGEVNGKKGLFPASYVKLL